MKPSLRRLGDTHNETVPAKDWQKLDIIFHSRAPTDLQTLDRKRWKTTAK